MEKPVSRDMVFISYVEEKFVSGYSEVKPEFPPVQFS
jgi:hypothetical protein